MKLSRLSLFLSLSIFRTKDTNISNAIINFLPLKFNMQMVEWKNHICQSYESICINTVKIWGNRKLCSFTLFLIINTENNVDFLSFFTIHNFWLLSETSQVNWNDSLMILIHIATNGKRCKNIHEFQIQTSKIPSIQHIPKLLNNNNSKSNMITNVRVSFEWLRKS